MFMPIQRGLMLFEESDYQFAVGNASSSAKNAALHLKVSYANGVAEMYEILQVTRKW